MFHIDDRVKLLKAFKPGPLDPVVGSPWECPGAVVAVHPSLEMFYVRWDNGMYGHYIHGELCHLDGDDQPLPKNNPNTLFKARSVY